MDKQHSTPDIADADVLERDDHMAGVERITFDVEKIWHPFPSVFRVTGNIKPSRPELWQRPNVAVRLEVESVEGRRAISRVYTIRRFNPHDNSIEIDFVSHADDSPAMRWLRRAKTGSMIDLVGPRPHFVPDYGNGKKVAFFADETAIPAIYSILQQWPDHARGLLYVECGDAQAAAEIPDVRGLQKHIYIRQADEVAGKTGSLVRAAYAFDKADDWQIWVACERDETRAIRKHFMTHCGLSKEAIKAIGYWRHGTSSTEIDVARLGYYTNLRAKGEGLKEFDDFELPI